MYYNLLEEIVTFEAFRIARTPPINPPNLTLVIKQNIQTRIIFHL